MHGCTQKDFWWFKTKLSTINGLAKYYADNCIALTFNDALNMLMSTIPRFIHNKAYKQAARHLNL